MTNCRIVVSPSIALTAHTLWYALDERTAYIYAYEHEHNTITACIECVYMRIEMHAYNCTGAVCVCARLFVTK